jgi:glycosyltransferase involved in cell wall biosynthesis
MHELTNSSSDRPRISVVIPTLDEAACLPGLLARLSEETPRPEIIVADGGSRDGTDRIALDHGARLVHAPRGRGQQLAAGAAAAGGGILLFLHADTDFPAGGLAAIAEALEGERELLGGNFRLVFDGATGFSRWLTGF